MATEGPVGASDRTRESGPVLTGEGVQMPHVHPVSRPIFTRDSRRLVHPHPNGRQTTRQHARRLADGQESMHESPLRDRVSLLDQSQRRLRTRQGDDSESQQYRTDLFGRRVVLKKAEWKALVDLIRSGQLTEL